MSSSVKHTPAADHFNALVEAECAAQVAKGRPRDRAAAVNAVVKRDPEAHANYVAEANER